VSKKSLPARPMDSIRVQNAQKRSSRPLKYEGVCNKLVYFLMHIEEGELPEDAAVHEVLRGDGFTGRARR